MCVLNTQLNAKNETTGSTSMATGHTQIMVCNNGTITFKTQIFNPSQETFFEWLEGGAFLIQHAEADPLPARHSCGVRKTDPASQNRRFAGRIEFTHPTPTSGLGGGTAEPLKYDPRMRLRKDAKIELIRSVPLFSRCTKKELAAIASEAYEFSPPEGTKLTRQGQRGREFIVIVDGSAEVVKNGRRIARLVPATFSARSRYCAAPPATQRSRQPRLRVCSCWSIEPSRAYSIRSRPSARACYGPFPSGCRSTRSEPRKGDVPRPRRSPRPRRLQLALAALASLSAAPQVRSIGSRSYSVGRRAERVHCYVLGKLRQRYGRLLLTPVQQQCRGPTMPVEVVDHG